MNNKFEYDEHEEVECSQCGNQFVIETSKGVPQIKICPPCGKRLNKQIKDKENARKIKSSEIH